MAIALYSVASGGSQSGLAYTNTFASAPVEGNVQIAWVTRRDGTASVFTWTGAGWTLIRRSSTTAGDSWPCAMYYRPVTAGLSDTDTVTGSVAGGNIHWVGAEFSGLGALDTDNGSGPATGQPNFSFTPTSGLEALLIAGVSVRNDSSPDLTVAGAMTELFADFDQQSSNGPRVGMYYQLVNPTTGSYTVGATGSTSARAVVAASFRAGVTDQIGLKGFQPVLIG